MLAILSRLEEEGYRIWYDDGIAPGSEWPENIAQHLDKSDVVLAFVTPNSMASANCRREITFALSRQKNFLGIMTEKTDLPLGVELQISAQQCILRYNFRTEEEFIRKIIKSEILDGCKKEIRKESPRVDESKTEETNTEEEQMTSDNLPEGNSSSVTEESDTITETAEKKTSEKKEINKEETNKKESNKEKKIKKKKTIDDSEKSRRKKITIISVAAVAVLCVVIYDVIFLAGHKWVFGNDQADTAVNNEDTTVNNDALQQIESQPEEEDSIRPAQRVSLSEYPAGMPVGYTLTEVGSFVSTEEFYIDDLTISIVTKQVVTVDGSSLPETFESVTPIGDGLYIVEIQNIPYSVPSIGLVSIEGEWLIPGEAAGIDFISDMDGLEGGRYLRVSYTQDITLDENNTFFMTSEGIGYTGEARIYDLLKRRFVPIIVSDNPLIEGYKACGSHIWIIRKDGSATLYDEEGNEVLSIVNSSQLNVGNGYYIIKDGESYDLYDENSEYCSSSGALLDAFESTSGYLLQKEGNGYHILDMDGNRIVSDVLDKVCWERFGLIGGTLYGDLYLYNRRGELLKNLGKTYNEYVLEGSGVVCYSSNGNEYFSGFAFNGAQFSYCRDMTEATGMCIHAGESGYALDSLSYSLLLEGETIDVLCPALAAVKSDSTGKYGVVDFYSGRTLLDYKYAQIEYGNGYIFARSMDNWTVYRVNTVLAGSEEVSEVEREQIGTRYRYYHWYCPDGSIVDDHMRYYSYARSFFYNDCYKEIMLLDNFQATGLGGYTDESGATWWFEDEEPVFAD
ncbi:MAG: toll/interleukin-1 receptor domain-containing protein [Lachnospiraceae bacterium]|nr:toll/interleukin-1 receptor domain-containing protein [Lachnospiraceae bacterium]